MYISKRTADMKMSLLTPMKFVLYTVGNAIKKIVILLMLKYFLHDKL